MATDDISTTFDVSHSLTSRLLTPVIPGHPQPHRHAAGDSTSRFLQLLTDAESRTDIASILPAGSAAQDGEFNGCIVECAVDLRGSAAAAAAAIGAQCGVLHHRVSDGVHHLSVVYLPSVPIPSRRPSSQGPIAVVQVSSLHDFAGGPADVLRQLQLWQCTCSSPAELCPFNAAQPADRLHGELRTGSETVKEALSKVGEEEYWSADGSRYFALSCALPIRRPVWLKALLTLPVILCGLSVVVLLH
jgi:hypothetical protein